MDWISFSLGFLTCFVLLGTGLACIAITKEHRNRILIRRISDALHEEVEQRRMMSQ